MLFNEIKEKTIKKIYLRTNELNQAKGLTDFIVELEKKAKEKNVYFNIISCSPKIVIPYEYKNFTEKVLHEDETEILIHQYVGFIYDNYYYYFQIDDNPFFEHYCLKIPLSKDKNGYYYYDNYYLDNLPKKCLLNSNIDELYSYNQTTRVLLKNNLLDAFYNILPSRKQFDKKMSYQRKHYIENEKQIYFNV